MSIMTSQLKQDNKDGLLILAPLDISSINNVSILYAYNTSKTCEYSNNETHSVNGNAAVYVCSKPITAIYNQGDVCHFYMNSLFNFHIFVYI